MTLIFLTWLADQIDDVDVNLGSIQKDKLDFKEKKVKVSLVSTGNHK